MKIRLATVEGVRRSGEAWTIAPTIPLSSFKEYERTLMMPRAGDEIEFRFPDGRVASGRIASFGVEVWRDSDGALYMHADPSDPMLTLTITSDADLSEAPAGAEVWLSEARFATASDAS